MAKIKKQIRNTAQIQDDTEDPRLEYLNQLFEEFQMNPSVKVFDKLINEMQRLEPDSDVTSVALELKRKRGLL